MSKNALEQIVVNKKMPVLFIGSGMSRRYLYRYPNWEELLNFSFEKIYEDSFQYQKHKDALTRKGLSPFEVNISLGTIIENEFNSAFYDRKIIVGNSKTPRWVKRNISPYKMFLSLYFKKMKLNHDPKMLLEIDKFRLLKSKVAAIITTNYDLFLENEIFSSDFKVFTHQHELFSVDSYDIAEIYKIHGSATDANSIMITEKDYATFNESRKLIIAKMLTLFAESPIVFLGYSFTDENIQKIIVEFLSCLSPDNLKNISEHFIFISYKKHENELLEIKRTITTRDGADIPITEIQTDNFSKVFDILNEVTPGISPVKIRETRRLVKTIVDQSIASDNADAVIVGIENLSEIDLTNKPLAIAIGYKESILNKIGYGLLSDEMILEDILLDNKNFDSHAMCSDRFKSIAVTRLLPVFKYVKKSNIDLNQVPKLKAYVETHNSVDKIISRNVLKTLKNIPELTCIEDLAEKMDDINDLNKKAGVLLKNIETLQLENLRALCTKLFIHDKESAKTSTHFKRCVMYLDLKENHDK